MLQIKQINDLNETAWGAQKRISSSWLLKIYLTSKGRLKDHYFRKK